MYLRYQERSAAGQIAMLKHAARGARRRARTLGAGALVVALAAAFLAIICIVARATRHAETPATLLAAPVADQGFRAARQVASRF
jgi:hypothetical protein